MKSAASIFAMSAAFSCGVIHQHSTMALQPPARMPMHRRPQPQTFPPIQKSSTVKESPQTKEESAETDNLSPFLREMVDEQRELQMNVGKAMDVLRNDYPYFLRRAPGEWLVSRHAAGISPRTTAQDDIRRHPLIVILIPPPPSPQTTASTPPTYR